MRGTMGKHENPQAMDKIKCSRFEQETSGILSTLDIEPKISDEIFCYWTRILGGGGKDTKINVPWTRVATIVGTAAQIDHFAYN
jgi:hypothetical protein